jgi:sporulation protein YlmC with PRC-barrel domain
MRRLSVSLLALAAMSSLAAAQTTAPSTPSSPPATTAPAAPPLAAPGATTAPSSPTAGATGGFFANVQPNELMTSNLIDLDVYNQANEKIGEIEDMILDNNKTVRAIVIGVGGFLGIGERHVAVEPSAVQVARDNNGNWRAVVNATREQLRTAPEFRYKGAWDD